MKKNSWKRFNKSLNFSWLVWGCIVVAFVVGWLLPSPWLEHEINYLSNEGMWVKDTSGMLLPGGNVYEGTVSLFNGKPEGYGVMKGRYVTYIGKWSDGNIISGKKTDSISSYEGQFNERFEKEGFGILRYTQEHINSLKRKGISARRIIEEYIGNWTGNKKNGLGRLVMSDTSMNFGYFIDDVFKPVKGAEYITGNLVYGIDLSHFQKEIDWDNLALYSNNMGIVSKETFSGGSYLQPVFFAFIKSTDGIGGKDRNFMQNMTMARKHGITRGAYHFFRAKQNVKAQVDNFTQNTIWFPGDLPPVLDMELDDEIATLGAHAYLTKALEWLKGVEETFGVQPIVYTSNNIYNKFVKNDDRFAGYKFWIARYSNVAPPIKNWEFWQFSGNGHALGIQGEVDLDLYNSDYKDFINNFEIKTPPVLSRTQ